MGEGVVGSGDGGEEGIGLGKSLGYSVRKGVGGSDGECVGVSVVGGSDGIEVVGSAVGDVLGEGVGVGVAATRAALFMRLLKLKMLLRPLFMRSGFILDGVHTYICIWVRDGLGATDGSGLGTSVGSAVG